MMHSIEILNEGIIKSLNVEEYKQDKTVCISLDNDFVILDKEDLHDFIGLLLHVQSKLKGGKNG